MPWVDIPTFDDPDQTRLAIAAIESGRFVAKLTPESAFAWVKARADQDWMRDAAKRNGPSCLQHLGPYNLIGFDDETKWPAYVVRVTLTPWKYAQQPESGLAAIYLDDSGSAVCVEIDNIQDWQKITPASNDQDPPTTQ